MYLFSFVFTTTTESIFKLLFDVKVTHQSLAVQEGCSTMAGCSPFGKADDMVQVPGQTVDILLLLF